VGVGAHGLENKNLDRFLALSVALERPGRRPVNDRAAASPTGADGLRDPSVTLISGGDGARLNAIGKRAQTVIISLLNFGEAPPKVCPSGVLCASQGAGIDTAVHYVTFNER
jgi:hypothetical protein